MLYLYLVTNIAFGGHIFTKQGLQLVQSQQQFYLEVAWFSCFDNMVVDKVLTNKSEVSMSRLVLFTSLQAWGPG